jgi:branched-chain amino acid transport system ATP-binding protein
MSVPPPDPILTTDRLSVSFGGLRALRDLSLRVAPGQLVGLIGPNGAGKTTCIDALTGFVRSSGRVFFDGHEISGLSPHRRARAGLVRTWQSVDLFADLTVAQNLVVGVGKDQMGQVLADLVTPARHRPAHDVNPSLVRFELEHLADRMPSELSAGQRKLVGVARSLAAGPKLVLIDEPAAGLNTSESVELGQHLRGVVDDGTAILLIDHDMGLVLTVCDYLYVLDFGQLIAEGPPDAIRRDERVLSAYLGESGRPLEVALADEPPVGERA